MNINLKFENVTWSKKIGAIFIAIGTALVIGICAIVIAVLFKHYDSQMNNAKEQAHLVSINVCEEIENITDSLEFISDLLTDESMASHITPSQVTTLLNELMSKDEKIFGAFVMLDKSEYAFTDLTDSMDFVDSDKEADEALELLEDNNELETEETKEVVSEEGTILDGVNKLVYKANGSTYETNLDRLNTLEYKKSYIKVMLTKMPQMMKPQKNTYNGVEVNTCTYTVPILINGNFEGIIGIDIDLDILRKEVQDKGKALSSEYIITDKQGNIISATNKSLENTLVQDLYKGNSNKKILSYINDNIESGIDSSFNAGSSDLLHDKFLVMTPVMIEDTHVWNILSVSYVDKIITNSIATILLVSIINVVLFALFIFVLWISFGAILNNKYKSLFNKVETELTKIKANSQRIMEDIEDIEQIEVDDDIEDDDIVVDGEPEMTEASLEELQKAEAEVKEAEEKAKAEKEAKEAEAKEETKEEVKEEPEEDNGFDKAAFEAARKETDEKFAAAEEEKKAEETKEEKPAEMEHEAVKVDLDNPATSENGEKLSAMDQLASSEAHAEGLDEILDNKDGSVGNSSTIDEMAAKLDAAFGGGDPAPSPAPAEEAPKEEPKAEETAPAPEAPKAEEPAPAPAPAPEPAPAPAAEEVHVDSEEELAAKQAKLKELQAKVAAKMKKEKDVYTVKVSHEDPDDLFGVPDKDRKLTNKEMDDLLKELEEKRKYEAETMGIVHEEFNAEDASIGNVLGGLTSDDM